MQNGVRRPRAFLKYRSVIRNVCGWLIHSPEGWWRGMRSRSRGSSGLDFFGPGWTLPDPASTPAYPGRFHCFPTIFRKKCVSARIVCDVIRMGDAVGVGRIRSGYPEGWGSRDHAGSTRTLIPPSILRRRDPARHSPQAFNRYLVPRAPTAVTGRVWNDRDTATRTIAIRPRLNAESRASPHPRTGLGRTRHRRGAPEVRHAGPRPDWRRDGAIVESGMEWRIGTAAGGRQLAGDAMPVTTASPVTSGPADQRGRRAFSARIVLTRRATARRSPARIPARGRDAVPWYT
jgi:hypothetical protein